MIDPSVFPGFLLACVVVCAVPGPDHAFIAAAALSRGRRAGLLATLGMSLGMCVHLVVTVLGIGALLQAVPAALDWIRALGAVYLVYLAWTSVRAARTITEPEADSAVSGKILRQSVIVNLTNPKMVLFMVSFLPQFARPDAGPVWGQLLILGLVLTGTGLIIDSIVGLAVGSLAEKARGRSAQRRMNIAAAVVYATLAIFLVIDTFR